MRAPFARAQRRHKRGRQRDNKQIFRWIFGPLHLQQRKNSVVAGTYANAITRRATGREGKPQSTR